MLTFLLRKINRWEFFLTLSLFICICVEYYYIHISQVSGIQLYLHIPLYEWISFMTFIMLNKISNQMVLNIFLQSCLVHFL